MSDKRKTGLTLCCIGAVVMFVGFAAPGATAAAAVGGVICGLGMGLGLEF